jgi:uncharacterized protein DUF7008
MAQQGVQTEWFNRDWLLDRLEAPELWGGGAPTPLSVAQLADRVSGDTDFLEVLELWVGYDNYELVKTLGALLADEHVPYLPVQRYKPAGLRKRALWERTWAQQRREDAGEKVEIDVPPKYGSADFQRASYWRARGKLDVPKERFVSYPEAGRDSDDSAYSDGPAGISLRRPARWPPSTSTGRPRSGGLRTGCCRCWPAWSSWSRGCISGSPRNSPDSSGRRLSSSRTSSTTSCPR